MRIITESPHIGKGMVSDVQVEGLVLDESSDSSSSEWERRQSIGGRCRQPVTVAGAPRRCLLTVFSQRNAQWGLR